ncbi:unnamed protein product, partial [Rangifer tarandus platyrhynchus]
NSLEDWPRPLSLPHQSPTSPSVRSLGQEDPLEEGMATHSSILTQRIPQTEKLAMDIHVFPIPIPPPTSLSTPSLWVFPVNQPRALVSCIQPGLVICFTLDNIYVSMLFSLNIPPSPSSTEFKSLFSVVSPQYTPRCDHMGSDPKDHSWPGQARQAPESLGQVCRTGCPPGTPYRAAWRLVGVMRPEAASGISEQPWSVQDGPSSLELHGQSAAAVRRLTAGPPRAGSMTMLLGLPLSTLPTVSFMIALTTSASSAPKSLSSSNIECRLMDMGRGEERVRCMERVTWKLTLPYPTGICCMGQEIQIGALYQSSWGVGCGGRWGEIQNGGDICSSIGKESISNAGDLGSVPSLGRSPAEGHDNPFQYSCLEKSMDRGTWWTTVHEVARVEHNLVTKPPPDLLHSHSIEWPYRLRTKTKNKIQPYDVYEELTCLLPSLSAIRLLSSAYLRLLIFLPALLIPACASSSPAFLMMLPCPSPSPRDCSSTCPLS